MDMIFYMLSILTSNVRYSIRHSHLLLCKLPVNVKQMEMHCEFIEIMSGENKNLILLLTLF